MNPFAACLLGTILWACSARGEQKPLVIFFGGSGFSESHVNNWIKAARRANSAYDYRALEYPPGAPDNPHEAVVKSGSHQIEKALTILRQNPGRKFILVGHSSGSALVDATIQKAREKNLISEANTTQVVLEGFRPRSGFKPLYCWTTKNPMAPNWNSMINNCSGGTPHDSDKANCGRALNEKKLKNCLHFSVVNSGMGYGDYSLNMEWLPNLEVPLGTGADKDSDSTFK